MTRTRLLAAALTTAGAAMTIAAFAGGGDAKPARTLPAATTITTTRATGDRGAEVFAEQGCGSCHTFAPANARGGIGPDLALSLHGHTRDYVLESIVAPAADVPQGWEPNVMPADFARRIAPADLDPLVAYLMEGAAG